MLQSIIKYVIGKVKIWDGTNTAGVTTENRLKVDAAVTVNTTNPGYVNRTDVNTTATASGNSSTLETEGYGCLNFQFNLSTISGTNPTIFVEIEFSEDGTNWTPGSTTLRLNATGQQRIIGHRAAGRYYRYKWTISGTSPSCTFTITTTLKAYLPDANFTFIRYQDLNLGSTSNVSTVFHARDCSNISIMAVRGAGGNASGFKIQGSHNNNDWADLTGNVPINASSTVVSELTGKAWKYYRMVCSNAISGGPYYLDLYWGANS